MGSKKGPFAAITPQWFSDVETFKVSAEEFPFVSTFTFQRLIEYWRQAHGRPDSPLLSQWKELKRGLDRVPELAGPIRDLNFLHRHREVVNLLISPFFPVHPWVTELKTLTRPLRGETIFRSHRLDAILGGKQDSIYNLVNLEKKVLLFWQILYAYKAILEKFYGLSLQIEQPIIVDLPEEKTGLRRYYKIKGYHPFLEINYLHPLPDLDKATFRYLVDHFFDMDLWMEHLPPEGFEFRGFTYYHYLDVTAEEAVARLKHLLLSQHGSITDDIFDQLQMELRILFRMPDISLGLASIQRNGRLNLHSKRKSWNSLKIRALQEIDWKEVERSLYGRVMASGQLLVVEDLSDHAAYSAVERRLLEQGVRSIAIIPLLYQDRKVGILELTSPRSGVITPLSMYKLNKVIPIFSAGINENLERFENRVQRVLKTHYTAIHPSVEWRFREAAIGIIDREGPDRTGEPESIAFKGVYPLYWAADIKDSTLQRHAAIRNDLLENLVLARELLEKVKEAAPSMVIDETLNQRLQQKIRSLQDGMSPGEETSTMEWIRQGLNPFLAHWCEAHPSLRPHLAPYMPILRSETGVLFKSRGNYEESLRQVNDTISGRLLAAQQPLQKFFPHYFEKKETDGVEYNIYIGDALVKERTFDPVYLHHFRMHQLLFSCQIAAAMHRLRDRLAIPFAITQLILVHSQPIDIRFRLEEKQFDVDGAYNVQYAVTKKRIDKATIKGSAERITKPGHISILYSLDKEREEYARYLAHLQARKYILGAPEQFDLEDMQGVQGLKAFRLRVNLEQAPESSLGHATTPCAPFGRP